MKTEPGTDWLSELVPVKPMGGWNGLFVRVLRHQVHVPAKTISSLHDQEIGRNVSTTSIFKRRQKHTHIHPHPPHTHSTCMPGTSGVCKELCWDLQFTSWSMSWRRWRECALTKTGDDTRLGGTCHRLKGRAATGDKSTSTWWNTARTDAESWLWGGRHPGNNRPDT